ncbi:Aldo/keto reductase [Metarhizium robertsii ARSEF 23]|uniref:Aldo/keto reductase n=1 Tax=Metarhizium robertsii (strain ARSEF 23 / ATCC MYA-3075) TaxID=655844 RepID=E9ESW2_METRA|nr:Aldo/keto reductase [Metarhizium robertsii ARSEF 23]EFZ01777.1 Aldo/keto reductase [Metarhizium robertsii ARSEF 23]
MPTIVGKQVGPIGYGLMGLTAIQTPDTDEANFTAIKTAIESGCTFLNGAEFYGTGPEENSLTLLRRYFAKYPEDAERVAINIKGGRDFKTLGFDGSPEGVARSIEHSLEQLGPVGRIAQWGMARKDLSHDYEDETLASIDGYVKSGRIDGISTSEINATTLRSAARKFRISALEIEVSLFHTDALTNGLCAACAELDIPVIAYSPLGRGLLGGRVKRLDDLALDDMRRDLPRFKDENLQVNLELVQKVEALARKKGCTPAQIAINWLLALSKRPGMPVIIPIPGSSDPGRIKENAAIIDLTSEDMAEIDGMLQGFVAAGDRYPATQMKYLQL